MKDAVRLAGYARRYWFLLLLSVLLMALMGAMTAARALLIKPIFGRVLNPGADSTPEPILTILHHPFYLEQLFPIAHRNVFTIVAVSIVVVFLVRGICDYLGDYLTSFVGFSAVTDLRNEVFAKLLRHGAAFFESTSTGRLMSSVMNDIDKIQTACSDMFADLLRQTFSMLALLIVIFGTDWRLALFALTLFPFVLIPTSQIGRRIRRTSRRTQDATGDREPARRVDRAPNAPAAREPCQENAESLHHNLTFRTPRPGPPPQLRERHCQIGWTAKYHPSVTRTP